MARPKKIQSENTDIVVKGESKISPISMETSVDMMLDMVKIDQPEFSGDLEQILGARCIGYLYARINGMNHLDAIQLSNVVPVEAEMWSKKQEFNSVMNMIKAAEASMVESMTWQQAMNPTASIERMFALKSRKAEYKENGAPVSQTVTNVRISIDGNDFDVSANLKNVEQE